MKLFVYGSLVPGGLNWDKIASGVLECQPASTAGYVFTRADRYLSLTDCPETEGRRVLGFVLTLSDDRDWLARLDEFEEYHPGNPAISQYWRVAKDVRLDDGASLTAWVYVTPPKA
jgi:gamma-glutamylcyclotransferase (GGCT)/AIG2-like uncharacterized protein YtfP